MDACGSLWLNDGGIRKRRNRETLTDKQGYVRLKKENIVSWGLL